MALNMFSFKRRPERRSAIAYFEIHRPNTEDVLVADSATLSREPNHAKRLLNEIKRGIEYDKVTFGPTFDHAPQYRTAQPHASCVSDNESLYLMVLLFELDSSETKWEIHVFQTVRGDSVQQLTEWTKVIGLIHSFLVKTLQAERVDWSTT